MIRQDLTQTQKRRLDNNNTCPICNNRIDDFDDIIFTVRRRRKCKEYTFYHEWCFDERSTINVQTEKEEETAVTRS